MICMAALVRWWGVGGHKYCLVAVGHSLCTVSSFTYLHTTRLGGKVRGRDLGWSGEETRGGERKAFSLLLLFGVLVTVTVGWNECSQGVTNK